MALPISPVEILEIVNFAYELVRSCQSAKGEFVQVGKEVNAMRSVMELVQILLEDPTSIINRLDNKAKSTSKQLGVHIGNCKQALSDVNALLKRYNKMSLMDRLAWAWSGHDEVEGLMANLSSFATQLDSFVDILALQGLDKLYQNQHSMRIGIGRIEELLEKNGGNEKAAVNKVMQDVLKTNTSRSHSQRYETVIADYANEAKREMEKQPATVERAPRDRKPVSGALAVPHPNKRAKSADGLKGKAKTDTRRSNSANPTTTKKRHDTLECWLIQIKSGDALFLKWQFSEKEIQPRGQWKLKEMAKQFKISESSKLNDNDDLVSWVVKDRQKTEDDPDYLWQPHAAKIESKGTLALNMGIERQAMVIIKRDLTPEAKAKVEAKEKKAQAEQAAAKKKAQDEAKADAKKVKDAELREIERKWKERRKVDAEEQDTAEHNAKAKANAKMAIDSDLREIERDFNERHNGKVDRTGRKAEIEKLRQEVERLKLAQKTQKDTNLGVPTGKVKKKAKSPSPSPSPSSKLKPSKDRKGSNPSLPTGDVGNSDKAKPNQTKARKGSKPESSTDGMNAF
ncbi:MAG: hypothetical protein Q9164_004193 [Protoblastenia rupestris]